MLWLCKYFERILGHNTLTITFFLEAQSVIKALYFPLHINSLRKKIFLLYVSYLSITTLLFWDLLLSVCNSWSGWFTLETSAAAINKDLG
jgi:hypothetical protein